MRRAHPLVRQEAVLAREPQDAAAAGADAGEAQPRPQLAVALAVGGAGGQELPDLPDQGLVRHRPERPGSLGGGFVRSVPTAVDGRPRHAPQARDPLDPVRLIRGGRDSAAHRLDLRRAKGRPASSCPILAPSSSFAIVSSPTFSFRRPISVSRASAGRLLSEASPAARNASRQPLSSAAVTPSPRETSSRPSPPAQPGALPPGPARAPPRPPAAQRPRARPPLAPRRHAPPWRGRGPASASVWGALRRARAHPDLVVHPPPPRDSLTASRCLSEL